MKIGGTFFGKKFPRTLSETFLVWNAGSVCFPGYGERYSYPEIYEVKAMKVSHTDENTGELLGHMYRNVLMGNESLCDVLPKITDRFLVTNVTSQMEKYSSFAERTAAELNRRSIQPQELSAMKKTMAKVGIAMNTMVNSSDRHIAHMIEKGTRMGVDELEGQMVRLTNEGCDMDVTALCREIVAFERKEADKMKDFE